MTTDYWNHNVAHHPMILEALPPRRRTALDVGCGDGMLVAKLAGRFEQVVGIDAAPGMIAKARKRIDDVGVEFVEGDVLEAARTGALRPGSFDLVCGVAVLHHMDFAEGLTAMSGLVAPGGRLVVIGHARNRSLIDWLIGGATRPVVLAVRLRHGGRAGPGGMPVREWHMSWTDVRRQASQVLPGSRYRRRLQLRYSIIWDRPEA
jgi:2-polyprenyl-3-methyl-5-hydroxy-6-metoxy-1,4-benzoquinol methylase